MNKSKRVKVLLVYVIFLLIGLGNIGGCATSEQKSGGDPELWTCDLTGVNSACKICAQLGDAACCTLSSPAGCGTVEQITTFTACNSDLQAACVIGTEPTPSPTPIPTPTPTQTPIPMPVPTPMPSPSPGVHTLTIVNECSEPVWIGMESINFTPLLCAANNSGQLAVGDCGPQGGQAGNTIPNDAAWTGPPPGRPTSRTP